jgi:hypothetical protein
MVASLRGMLRQSVPIYDHAPSLGSKLIRISASGASLKSKPRLAF